MQTVVETVHLFVARGRFKSITDIYEFIDQTITEEGETVESPFMREVELSGYEPMRIEAIHSARPLPLAELVKAAPHADQWSLGLDATKVADSAICVFGPNAVAHPERTSLEYVGAFLYRTVAAGG